jgi:hypothetical protein
MKRREFLQTSLLSVASVKLNAASTAALQANGATRLCEIVVDDRPWVVWEHLSTAEGALVFSSASGSVSLERRLEATSKGSVEPYLGLTLRDIALADADLLADRLLAAGKDPDANEVRDAAPPLGSRFEEKDTGRRLPWTTFVGTRQAEDTMPVFANGRTRTFRPEHAFPELANAAVASEGLLGGWMPAVHKVIPRPSGGYWDLVVFADVDADERFIVQTWHRTVSVEHGRAIRTEFGHSHASYPPRRKPPTAEAFYSALLRFASAWTQELADVVPATLPEPEWADLVKHAFAKELMVRPGGVWPKYGAVDRDYYGGEYDGFQDTFTSSLYSNMLWGRFAQARAVLDQYFTHFVLPNGLVDMRGPETAQFGLTLALLARYAHWSGDRETLQKHRDKIAATAGLLVELHQISLALPPADRGYGLIHGWNESDACLQHDPQLWWKPYWANSAFAVRGWQEIASVWTSLGGSSKEADEWTSHAATLKRRLETALRADIRRDLRPAYVGPLPGTSETFRQALSRRQPSEQGWPHRAYAELLQSGVLPNDLQALVVDCLRGHGGTTLGVLANISAIRSDRRDLLGFISYGYAEALLRLDRVEEYLLFLYSHRFHVHSRGNWVAGEVTDITGGLPLFCMPAQLTIPLLVRWMLVYEDPDRDELRLAPAVPTKWVLSGKPVGIERAPTRWGPVSFSFTADPDGRYIRGEVRLPPQAPKNTSLRLRLPAGRSIRHANLSISGRHRDTLTVGGHSAPVVSFSVELSVGGHPGGSAAGSSDSGR